jgi:O-antigen/teichoic acid export membrane protein
VRVSFVGAVERALSPGLVARARPYARILDSILYDSDDRAVSQRVTLIVFLGRIFGAALAYLSQILLARWMGDFEYGVFAIVWVGAVILGGLACLGFQTTVIRLVPEYIARGDQPHLRGVLRGSRVQGLLVSTMLTLAGMGALYAFGDHLSSYYLMPLFLGAVTLPMLALGEIQEGISRAFNWADLAMWPAYMMRPIVILVLMWLSLELGYAPTAVTAMATVIIATYLTVLVQFLALQRRIRPLVPAGPRAYQHMRWTGIALPIFIVEGFFLLLTNIDIIVVGYFMEPDQVAVYFAAAKTLTLVHMVYYAVRAGGAQRFSQYHASGDHVRLAAFTRDTLHWTFWPSLVMVLLLLVTGKWLLSLFGPDFEAGYPLLVILSIGLLVRAAIGPAESLLTMAGQQGICAAMYSASFFLNLVLNVVLIPRFGLIGAATATAISLAALTVVLYWVTYSRLGIRSSIFDAFRVPHPIVGAKLT